MSLAASMRAMFPFLFRGRPTLPRGETLALRPVRNKLVAWERRTATDEAAPEAALALHVPRRDDTVGRALARLFQAPGGKTIVLDEFGAQIWERCDGAHSIAQLVDYTSASYKLNRRQAEVSVLAFMKMLVQRRLIGFVTIKAAAEGKGSTDVNPSARRTKRSAAQRQQRAIRAHARRN